MIQVVTIDGPAGAGKSSVARCLAARLGWQLLDTGAMYRAVTLAAIRRQLDFQSTADLRELVTTIDVLIHDNEIHLDGELVTAAIRTPEVTRLTKHVADCVVVRQHLVAWQRRFAERAGNVIAEGRDQGTIVFPNALRKYFLTANDEERAKRRQAELAAQGDHAPLDEVLRRVRERDMGDRARTIAPMIPAADARIVDSTGLELERVVDFLEAEVRSLLDPVQPRHQS